MEVVNRSLSPWYSVSPGNGSIRLCPTHMSIARCRRMTGEQESFLSITHKKGSTVVKVSELIASSWNLFGQFPPR